MYSCKKNAISSKIRFDIHWGQRKGQMVWLITHKHIEGSLNVSEPLNLQKLLWVKFEIKKIKHSAQCNAHRKRDLYEHQNMKKKRWRMLKGTSKFGAQSLDLNSNLFKIFFRGQLQGSSPFSRSGWEVCPRFSWKCTFCNGKIRLLILTQLRCCDLKASQKSCWTETAS